MNFNSARVAALMLEKNPSLGQAGVESIMKSTALMTQPYGFSGGTARIIQGSRDCGVARVLPRSGLQWFPNPAPGGPPVPILSTP